MKKIDGWYDLEYVAEHINELDTMDFSSDNGKKIKFCCDIYGESLNMLLKKYGRNVFSDCYDKTELRIEDEEVEDLEKRLISDFVKRINSFADKYDYVHTTIDKVKLMIEYSGDLFGEEIVNIFSKNISDELLNKIYNAGRFKIYPYNQETKEFIKILSYEEIKPFLSDRIINPPTIKEWLEKDSDLQISTIIEILKHNSEYYELLCNKILEKFPEESTREEQIEILIYDLQKYTNFGKEPEISYIEDYLFLPNHLLKELAKPGSNVEGIMNFYDSEFHELVDIYGIEIFKKLYSSNWDSLKEELKEDESREQRLVKDIKNAIKEGKIKISYEQYKKIYERVGTFFVSEDEKKLFEKYPDEILKELFDDSWNAEEFKLKYSTKNPEVIFENMEYQDYKSYIDKSRWNFLAVCDLLKKHPDLDVDKVMPYLVDISVFYEDLYNKVKNENSEIEDEQELKEKIKQELFIWREKNGVNFPKIYDLKSILDYDYVRPDFLYTCLCYGTNKEYKKIADFFGKDLILLIRKYGTAIFRYTYGLSEEDLDIANNEDIDLERKLLADFDSSIKKNIIYVGFNCSYEEYKNIVNAAPKDKFDFKNKLLFQKYSDDILKNIYLPDQLCFRVTVSTKNIVDVLKNMDYEDIQDYISGYWFSDDTFKILKEVFGEDNELKVKNFYDKNKKDFSVKDCLVVLHDTENIDKTLEYLEKIPNIDIFNVALKGQNSEKSVFDIIDYLYEKYGDYLKDIDIKSVIKETTDFSFENIEKIVEDGIVDAIKNRKIKEYGENLPEDFKAKHSDLFITLPVSEEFKNKFYSRTLQYKDFIKNGEVDFDFEEVIKSVHLYLGMQEDVSFLSESYNFTGNIENLNKRTLEVGKRLADLEENSMTPETKKVFMKWTQENIKNFDENNEIFSKKLRNLYVLVEHIILSNSSELRRFQDGIVEQLLDVENPMTILKKIESGFLAKEKSIDERLYQCFRYLHPNFIKFCKTATSPLIKKYAHEGNKEKIEELLQCDVLKSILGSNNSEMRTILEKEECSEYLKKVLKNLGYETPQAALKYMDQKYSEADSRNRSISKVGSIKIEQGDIFKGLTFNGIHFVEKILRNGSCCKEFLGDDATTDCTPLDTDVSIIGEEGITKTYSYNSWGPIFVLLKRDDRFVKYPNKYQDLTDEIIEQNKNKLELCGNDFTGGIRTAFSSTDINAFVIKGDVYDKRLALEIAKNGLYIPIVDCTGKVLFKEEQYEELRKKMMGLSHYGLGSDFDFGNNLVNEDILEIKSKLDNIHNENSNLESKILEKINIAIGKYNARLRKMPNFNEENLITVYDGIMDTITENVIEVLSTGSSDRDTNVPDGKLDFDYIIRFDNKFFKSEKGKKAKKEIIQLICDELKIAYSEGDIKDVGINLDDKKVKADFSFIGKTDKMEYSTEMCLSDRLDSIGKLDSDKKDFVIANIVLAKSILGDVYKKRSGGIRRSRC